MKHRVAPLFAVLVASCGSSSSPTPDASAPMDAPDIVDTAVAPVAFCTLGNPVAGATVPDGYCVREFVSPAVLGEPRAIAFAPNGDLFVAAPSMGTAGGAAGGAGALLVLSDDDFDGTPDVNTYLGALPDIHGIAMAEGSIYFTRANAVWRTSYAPGQRVGTDMNVVATLSTSGRWTHGLGRTAGGTLYVTSASNTATCPATRTDVGRIESLQPDGTLTIVATGLRNPMYMRCFRGDEVCLASELGDDGGGAQGAHDKIFLVRAGTDYGFPCCNGVSEPALAGAGMSCASVTLEEAQIELHDTPFGLDWEPGIWPDPTYRGALFVARHGSFYSPMPWAGEGIFYAPTDAVTHAPTAPFQQFVGGFGSSGTSMRRPSDVAFAPDGRMFFADDQGGGIYFVAPVGSTR